MSNLLQCPFKKTFLVDNLGQGLSDYIQSYYEDETSHPDALRPDLDQIESMRKSIETDLPIQSNSQSLLIRYYAHLSYLTTKFPADIGVRFTYEAIFSTPSSTVTALLPGQLPTTAPISLNNIQYERACVLFNAGAMSIALGASQPRSNVEQLKRVVKLFEQAAGCFTYLRIHLVKLIETPAGSPQPCSPDLSDACLTALEFLALAQAQECVWQNTVLNKMKHSTISKIAMETSHLYEKTLQSMKAAKQTQGPWIGFSFPDDWIKFVSMKTAHFYSVAQYRESCDDSAEGRYGIEVGRLQAAHSTLKKAIAATKSSPDPATQAVLQDSKGLFAKLTTTLEASRRDNDLIYLKDVPIEGDLPPIRPFSLVKSTIPNTVQNALACLREATKDSPEGFGRKLFEFVVPYRVYRVRGVYDDRKREKVKVDVVDVAENLESAMAQSLQSMNLPGSLEALERPINLPPSVIRNSQELRSENAPHHLFNMFSAVEQASMTNAQTLRNLLPALSQEQQKDDHLRTRFGTQRWTILPSKQANMELRRDEAQLREHFDTAVRTDHMMKQSFQELLPAIQLLCSDEDSIQRAIPRPRFATLPTYDHDTPTSTFELSDPRQLRCLLDEAKDLSEDRNKIVSEAQRFAARDEFNEVNLNCLKSSDIDRELTLTEREEDETQIEHLLEEELNKYNKFEEELKINEQNQNNLIDRIKEANEAFLHSRTQDPLTLQRQEIIQRLEWAFNEYKNILGAMQKSLEFHQGFNKLVEQARIKIERYIISREAQFKKMIAMIEKEEMCISKLKLEANQNQDGESLEKSNGSSSTNKLSRKISKGKKKSCDDADNERSEKNEEEVDCRRNEEKNISGIQPGVYDPAVHGPLRLFDG